MHFSVTKEVGWEADDEREGPKPNLGVKKRYRFILDFSRRSSKAKRGPSRGPPPESEAEEEESIDLNEDANSRPRRHYCYNCEALRSDQYHKDYPLRRGKNPRPSLCAHCRFHRKARLADVSRDGRRRRQASEPEPRGDEREWCTNCGTLRSKKYHDGLLSGEQAPWNEICGRCVINMVKKKNRDRLWAYYDELVAANRGEGDRHDPLRDSLQHRRSSPYVFTPVSSREEGNVVSAATSASGLRDGFEHAKDPKHGGPPLATTRAREDMSGPSSSTSKAPERPQANIRRATVENHTSEDDRTQVPRHGQVRRGPRETQQPQQQAKSRDAPPRPTTSGNTSCEEAYERPKHQQPGGHGQPRNTQAREEPRRAAASGTMESVEPPQEGRELRDYFRPSHLEEYYKRQTQPKTRPHEPRDKAMPGPAPASSPGSPQNQEPYETRDYFRLPNPKRPLQPGEEPATVADSKQRREPGERREIHPTRHTHHTHRKRMSMSSVQSPVASVAEPVYFKCPLPAKVQAQKPKPNPRPAYSTNTLPNRRKPDPEPQARPEQPQPQPQPRYHQQKQQRQQEQPSRPMGVSDMYWSSEHGRAEQAFTAARFFFPDAAHDGGFPENVADPSHLSTGPAADGNNSNHGNYRSNNANSRNNHGNNGSNNSNRNSNSNSNQNGTNAPHPSAFTSSTTTEHAGTMPMPMPIPIPTPDFGHVFRASMGHMAAAAAATEAEAEGKEAAAVLEGDGNQIWEVDSDEAEEIEEGHARLVAEDGVDVGGGKGKGRGGGYYGW
ncbi:hypothetical protein B0I37DRAFT_349772 [Chaetomium sp. MPI-CAGE-AT-0009]|nr:hypothetical protein B0I37DRAFT_349772 [Chaetomium sp. MPI-CAGE-AT-0009]